MFRCVGNRKHEVGNVVRFGVDIPIPELLARDFKNFILDDIIQVERTEDQIKRTFQ